MRHVMIIYVYACTLKCDKVIFVKYSKGVSSVCTFELATTHRIRSVFFFVFLVGVSSARVEMMPGRPAKRIHTHTHTHTYTHTLSLSLSLSHTHTHVYT